MFKPRHLKKLLQFLGLALGLSGLMLIGLGILLSVFIIGSGIYSFFVPTVNNPWQYLWLVGFYFFFGVTSVYISTLLLGQVKKLNL